jgi:D-tyrosyl-tRNA(Tyr) deacylase
LRIVVQRVNAASVSVADDEIASINRGFLALAAFSKTDTEEIMQWMARKLTTLRLFEDVEGKMNLDLDAVEGELLVVSQFTLYGDCTKGKRPSFEKSAPVSHAEVLYERFLEILGEVSPCPVRSGVFREHMSIGLVNDGPVTVILERESP